MMICKKISLHSGACFFIGAAMWVWVLIAPEASVLWIIPSLAGMILFQKLTLSRLVFSILCIWGVWSLECIQQTGWIRYAGVCSGVCLPMSAWLKARCSFDRVFWAGFSFIFAQYLIGLRPENTYWFLKSLLFPISLCICVCFISTLYRWGEHFFEIYRMALGKYFLIFFGAFNYAVVVGANVLGILGNRFYAGIYNKHRILFLSFVTLSVVWKLMDCKYRKEAAALYILLLSTMWCFQCRLGMVGVLLAHVFRYMVLHHRKVALVGVQGMWISGVAGVGFYFQRILEIPWLVSMCSVNSSFYERLILWRHFETLAQPVFLFGMGMHNFFSSVFQELVYCGINGKKMEVLPSHTHCIWLDVKLSFGVVGLIILSAMLLWWVGCVWKKIFSLKDATNFAIYIYAFILYSSFFGVFWHIFVLSWVLLTLVLSKILYTCVPCGTCLPCKN